MQDKGMNCPTCGALVPVGRQDCETCGASLLPRSSLTRGAGIHSQAHLQHRSASSAAQRNHQCPQCHYRGEGIGYFSRGSRVAALVGVTLVTMGAMGAGGLVYYLVRKDHMVCPRCGHGWGQNGERAVVREGGASELLPAPATSGEGRKKGWSVLLFLLAAIFVLGGVAAAEVGMVGFGLLAAGSGVLLRQAAGRDREKRREALISSMQLPVLKLAAQQRGRLTVTEVAAHLGWPMRRAEKILQSLDDGIRVDSEVTDEGVIVYEFRELMLASPDSPQRHLREGGAH